jgi:NAD dependent epimerase/dehydratase family enzyme
MSWIHLEDQIGLILHALERDEVEGPLNATAPNPVKNRAFSKALGRALGRPAITPTPGFVLKLMLGEMAQALLLEGQKVLPSRAIATGYRFRFPEIHLALQDLLKRQF